MKCMDLAEATARDQARDDLNFGSYYRPIRCTQPYIRCSGALASIYISAVKRSIRHYANQTARPL